MLKNIVNSNFKVLVTQMGTNFPGLRNADKSNFIINESSSTKVTNIQALTNQIMQSNAPINWGCKGPTKDTTAVSEIFSGGIITIVSTAQKNKADGLPVMLEGDFCICNCVCTAPQKGGPPPPPVITPGVCKIEIINAGQSTVKGI